MSKTRLENRKIRSLVSGFASSQVNLKKAEQVLHNMDELARLYRSQVKVTDLSFVHHAILVSQYL